MLLSGKNILVCLSGGIAAYKTPILIRLLVKQGCQVKVIATENALKFTTEITLQTLSGHRVYRDMFLPYIEEETTKHISLTSWADYLIVAPATANVIGKYANGIADDALTTTLLAFTKQVFIAPAMNSAMYDNFAVRENINKLKNNGVEIIEPNDGPLACGVSGKGRMAEPEEIVDFVEQFVSMQQDFKGKSVMITAGPTREQIDKVRFISNNSSGKMGYELAKNLLCRGAKVYLISGPSHEHIEANSNLELIKVESSEQMYNAALQYFAKSDIAICSAAVADYTPKNKVDHKMKKQEISLCIELEPTKDILKELGQRKGDKILVGFALETDNEVENAKAKLERKNLDFIVLNSLNDKGAGFEVATNKVTLIDKQGVNALELKPKSQVAKDIIDKILTFL